MPNNLLHLTQRVYVTFCSFVSLIIVQKRTITAAQMSNILNFQIGRSSLNERI
jgi:hypothetical protein